MTTGQVLYRKWRPQTLGEVVGQGPITQTLLNALRQDRVGHAYLFTGPRGTGKTSTARILAKAVNCETNEGRGEPCNVCSSCREITNGAFLDIIEIDAASNRGIDEVRDLREKVRFMPARGRKKVYIIDEVHMMTDAAFNALLKTLEEPPGHAIFILATTEPHKIPLTIASRCQRFDFRRIPSDAAVERLAEIASSEGFSIAREALEVVVRASSGSLRDAANLLEQLALTSGSEATAQDARDLFGVAGSARAREIIKTLLVEKDLASALRGLSHLQAEGIDMRQVHRELVEELRTLLLLGAGAGDVLDLAAEEMAERRNEAGRIDLAVIRGALGVLASLSIPSGGAPLPLEMAFVGITLDRVEAPKAEAPAMARPEQPVVRPPAAPSRTTTAATTPPAPPRRPVAPSSTPVANSNARPQATPPVATPAPVTPPPPPSTTRESTPAAAAQVSQSDAASVADARSDAEPVAVPTPPPSSVREPAVAPSVARPAEWSDGGNSQETAPISLEELQSRWREIVDGLRGVGSSGNLDAFLRSVSIPIAVDDETIVIGFYHDFHKQKIEDPKYRHLVEQKMTQILGRHYKLRCERVERAQPRGHLVRAAVSRGAQRVEEPPSEGDDGPDPEGGD